MKTIKFINYFSKKISNFYKTNSAKIIFLAFLLPLLTIMHKLQYINIIPQYYYYVVELYLILIIILFGRQISKRKLYIIVQILIPFALVINILELFFPTLSADIFGFVIFVIVAIVTAIDFVNNRSRLKQMNE